jgi:hypothetical protein
MAFADFAGARGSMSRGDIRISARPRMVGALGLSNLGPAD